MLTVPILIAQLDGDRGVKGIVIRSMLRKMLQTMHACSFLMSQQSLVVSVAMSHLGEEAMAMWGGTAKEAQVQEACTARA